MAKERVIIKLFERAGEAGSAENLLKFLKDKFVDMYWQEFQVTFRDAFLSVIVTQSPLTCSYINNMISFAACSVVVVSEHSSRDGRSGMYLISDMLRLCRTYGISSDKLIRWRLCLFLNYMLNRIASGRVLPVELCDVATSLLLERLQDKKPEVRTQAALALNRLQEPEDPKCHIVTRFVFHMTCDTSADVRVAIVKKIAMFSTVVDEMLKKTIIDINDNVRKEVYIRFFSYPFSSLTPKQRQTILEKGLDDKNENIKTMVKTRLLMSWLKDCDNNIIPFLSKLGVENESVCENVLCIIFETCYDSQVLDMINEFLDPNSRMINFDQLTAEKIFLWKCVAKYLTTEKKIELGNNQGNFGDDYIDPLLPDLVKFSEYIREYYFENNSEDKEFILIQLLDVAMTFTFDDVGSKSINKLCMDLILDEQTSVKPIELITRLLDLTFVNGKDILNYVKEVLNEIYCRTTDVYPLVEEVGKKSLLDHKYTTLEKKIEKSTKAKCKPDPNLKMYILQYKRTKKQLDEFENLSQEEILAAEKAVKNLLKGFELVFQVQQFIKVGLELSLLTDIIQNIMVGYLECPLIELRMKAIHALSPYMMINVSAAKEHITTLCAEISNPMTDRHMIFKVMFELFLLYDLNTFNISEDLDIAEEYKDHFNVGNILPLLVSSIDYTVEDSSFKSVVLSGLCDLLLYKQVKSIALVSKLLVLWFRSVTPETCNIYNNLVKFFTTYVYHFDSSSSTMAKCYVGVLREINDHNLIETLNIKIHEVNTTLINLSGGQMYRNAAKAINAHSELAGYIIDYLSEEDQPYTDMLIDTLYKLEIDFDGNDELIMNLGPKLMCVIKHFKHSNDRSSAKHLKKIKNKFDPVLQKKSYFMKKVDQKEVDHQAVELEVESQATTSVAAEESEPVVDVVGDLFSKEDLLVLQSSDDEDSEDAFTKLDAMKRMSEIFKRSMNIKTGDDSSSFAS